MADVKLRDGVDSNDSALSKTLPLNIPVRGAELVGTVACAAGPSAALRGVAGMGDT